MLNMKKSLSILLTLFLVNLATTVFAQDVTGVWTTIDDKTGKPKSEVKIYVQDGKLYGKIIKLFREDPNADPLCDKCKGNLHNQHILGMQIINGLTQNDDGQWVGDDGIMDPENGKFYDVKLWREGNVLRVRGYIGFLYRTQEWEKS